MGFISVIASLHSFEKMFQDNFGRLVGNLLSGAGRKFALAECRPSFSLSDLVSVLLWLGRVVCSLCDMHDMFFSAHNACRNVLGQRLHI